MAVDCVLGRSWANAVCLGKGGTNSSSSGPTLIPGVSSSGLDSFERFLVSIIIDPVAQLEGLRHQI